jgi:hypothetical protein
VEIGKTRNCVDLSQFPRVLTVDITVYQYGKNILYIFYNIPQRNTKKYSEVFRVDIELHEYGS